MGWTAPHIEFYDDEPDYVGAHRWPEVGEPGRSATAHRQRRSWRRFPARVVGHPNYEPRHLEPELGSIEFTAYGVFSEENAVPIYATSTGQVSLEPTGLRVLGYVSKQDAAKIRGLGGVSGVTRS